LEDFGLAAGLPAWGREFWTGETHYIESGALDVHQLGPHGVYFLAVRPHHPGLPQYLGSDLHISQGLEVMQWQPAAHALAFRLERPMSQSGSLELSLPARPDEAFFDDAPLEWEQSGEGRYRFSVALEQRASIRISWQTPAR
jgi:hypothetical protein